MYSTLPSFVLGFHGCDKELCDRILAGNDTLRPSNNEYDWLGPGIYFWENDPERALNYARLIKAHPERCTRKINEPAVIGAVIDLKHCLNLFEVKALGLLREAHKIYKEKTKKARLPLAKNKRIGKEGVLIRTLDCAVIRTLHAYNRENKLLMYDSIRSPFLEGKNLYSLSGFKEKNHIQICILNPNCIKGYFRPADLNPDYPPAAKDYPANYPFIVETEPPKL
jgi:hypothetical protein